MAAMQAVYKTVFSLRISSPIVHSCMRLGVRHASHHISAPMNAGAVKLSPALPSSDANADSVETLLDSLQSNEAALQQRRLQRWLRPDRQLLQTSWCLQQLGIEQQQLQQLNVVHVAGTKGKGSTCALLEALLRAHGYRTGFYSSPHLVTPRERIKLHGLPLGIDQFSRDFRHVHNVLRRAGEMAGSSDSVRALWDGNPTRMPMYFMFLTVMAYYVFVRERVDVAIIETGIGGRFDCTNIVERPVVCGITALDLEHTEILGNSIEQIAWQKGGIMKHNVPVVVAPQRYPSASRVLAACASDVSVRSMFEAPRLASYYAAEDVVDGSHDISGVRGDEVRVSLAGKFQRENASLALQLWRCWQHWRESNFSAVHNNSLSASSRCAASSSYNQLDITSNMTADSITASPSVGSNGSYVNPALPFTLTAREQQALANCSWPGRSQVINRGQVSYYLDGAHTAHSIEQSFEWYRHSCLSVVGEDANLQVLVVYISGGRDAGSLLSPLFTTVADSSSASSSGSIRWTHILFCSPETYWVDHCTNSADDVSQKTAPCTVSDSVIEQRLAECEQIRDVGTHLIASSQHGRTARVEVVRCTSEAVHYIEQRVAAATHGRVSVFVVGSLHLVGGFLSLIDPHLSHKSDCISCDI